MPERRHSGITAFRLTSLPELWRDRWPAIWYSGIMNVTTIANQKGGTGKTTSAAAFAVLLSRCGIATHLVDMDPQASLSAAFGHVDPGGRLFEALACRSSLPITRVADHLTSTFITSISTARLALVGSKSGMVRLLDGLSCV